MTLISALSCATRGYRILYTPEAELYHHEHASRGSEYTAANEQRFAREIEFMKDKWEDALVEGSELQSKPVTRQRTFHARFPPESDQTVAVNLTPGTREIRSAKFEIRGKLNKQLGDPHKGNSELFSSFLTRFGRTVPWRCFAERSREIILHSVKDAVDEAPGVWSSEFLG